MPKMHVIIFANGEIADYAALEATFHVGDLLVAADGGLRHLRKMNLTPALLIGDLDSLTPEEVEAASAEGVFVQQFPRDKNETDLELALSHVLQAGFKDIRIAGALGGRLDHTLGNINLLLDERLAACDVRLEDGREEVFIIRGQAVVEGQPGDIVSLIPIGGDADRVTTSDLKYPLAAETLRLDRTRGISNVMLKNSAEISLEKGRILCIHRRMKGKEYEQE
ncbi:MAG: thiamine diphosphokinase [Anaerolineaceae bacterium]